MAAASPQEDPVLARLRAAAARGALSHALLFTGTGDALAAARFAAAAFQCTGPEDARPCGVCPACRKVREDIHPDVVTVRDEQHKFLAVEVIRDLRSSGQSKISKVRCPRLPSRSIYPDTNAGSISNFRETIKKSS